VATHTFVAWRVVLTLHHPLAILQSQRGDDPLLKTTLENKNPRLHEALLFHVKTTALRAQKASRDFMTDRPERFAVGQSLTNAAVIAESRTPLWTEQDRRERSLVTGKIQNLRSATRHLNGIEVGPNQVFSFWRQIGRAARRRGYVLGRELRQGCLIPSVGGGLCQLSNALYDAALKASFEIVERHAHTQVIPGSLAESERDATVFWNYVDLRFKAPHAFRVEIDLTSDSLVVRLRGTPTPVRARAIPSATIVGISAIIGSCYSCEQETCSRHSRRLNYSTGQTAYLLDEYWPEFDQYVSVTRNSDDTLLIPLDGQRWGKSNYAWHTAGFAKVKQSRLRTLLRAYRSRRLRAQGAERQRTLLKANESLAKYFASCLTHEQTHLVVMQDLLPYLWRDGHLGGRTFDVLMTRLPLSILQRRLDDALRTHPQSKTLGDFRADESLVRSESEALIRARQIVSPHSEIASLFPDKTVTLDWVIPKSKLLHARTRNRLSVAFPAATLGRKGVYELREALRDLDAELLLAGPVLEGKDFWQGLRVVHCDREDWLESATAVVLPSLVENKPRRLLEAVAQGLPVVTSEACGISNVAGVTIVRTGDVNELRAALEELK
jgi:glycosyltransferase involved in cell wall biosynthesis